MAKILVLGSEGQIGSPLTRYLWEMGHDVVEYDIARDEAQDLRRYENEDLFEIMENGVEFVYFLAFDVGGSKYLKTYEQSFDFIDNNVKIMDNTFNLLNYFKIPFIFASSQMSNMSYSVYGQLKAIGESYTKSLGGLSVKFWNVYGYEEDEEKAHVITDFIRMAMEDGEIRMMTDGTEERQFLYVEDCVRALDELRKEYDRFVGTPKDLCITNFYWSSIMEVAEHIAVLTGATIVPGTATDTVQLDKRNMPDVYLYSELPRFTLENTFRDGISKVLDQMRSVVND